MEVTCLGIMCTAAFLAHCPGAAGPSADLKVVLHISRLLWSLRHVLWLVVLLELIRAGLGIEPRTGVC